MQCWVKETKKQMSQCNTWHLRDTHMATLPTCKFWRHYHNGFIKRVFTDQPCHLELAGPTLTKMGFMSKEFRFLTGFRSSVRRGMLNMTNGTKKARKSSPVVRTSDYQCLPNGNYYYYIQWSYSFDLKFYCLYDISRHGLLYLFVMYLMANIFRLYFYFF